MSQSASPDPSTLPGDQQPGGSAGSPTVLVAGATGDLGVRVVDALLTRGATVRALVRTGSNTAAIDHLRPRGLTTVEAAYDDADALQRACAGSDVVVSTVAGLRPVVVDAQSQLLHAAVAAGVPRFIPSDYSLDHTRIPEGSNRNLQLRRDFRSCVDAAPIEATSVLVGAFADMLTGQAPLVLFDRHRVLYWKDADQVLDFTTKDDTAAYTAEVALDRDTPRFLRVAGDQVSARDIASTMTELTGEPHRLTHAGGVGLLRTAASVGQRLSRSSDELYPWWQGMQYFANMFSGEGKLRPLDNDRYGHREWTSAREVLAAR